MHTERHMFPGNNTSRGFYSYYPYIVPYSAAEHIYILKGGPGVGKSTFMRRIAEKAALLDFDIEFMHCSSDPDSLDAVFIPQKKVLVVDGTAPHVIDPKFPGAIDEIINLGDCWNQEGLKEKRAEIVSLSVEVSRIFARAYRYLNAAARIYENLEEIYSLASDKNRINLIGAEIIDTYFKDDPMTEKEGSLRRLFATAITPDGLRDYLPSALNTSRKIILKGSPGTGTEKILAKVLEDAVSRGYDTEAFYCALFPEKLEHIVIRDKDLSIATSNKYHTVPTEGFGSYDLDPYLNKDIIKAYDDYLQYNRLEFEGLLHRAIYTLSTEKIYHDRLERIYVDNMDFEKRNAYADRVIEKVFG
jgi:hypothetical protein